jgi:SAM-dependent methyltransferase
VTPDIGDVDFCISLANKHGSPLLELACGTGRVTIPLARAGHTVVGVDISEEMLAIARDKLRREPADLRERVTLQQGDMRRFELGMHFGLIAIPYSSLFHLHADADRAVCLSAIHAHLAEGGVAVIDLAPANRMANQEVGVTRVFGEGVNPATGKVTRNLGRKLSIDKQAQCVTVEHTYIEEEPDGSEARYVFVDRYTWATEDQMLCLLLEAGFGDVSVLGGYDGRPFDDTSERMILVAS